MTTLQKNKYYKLLPAFYPLYDDTTNEFLNKEIPVVVIRTDIHSNLLLLYKYDDWDIDPIIVQVLGSVEAAYERAVRYRNSKDKNYTVLRACYKHSLSSRKSPISVSETKKISTYFKTTGKGSVFSLSTLQEVELYTPTFNKDIELDVNIATEVF